LWLLLLFLPSFLISPAAAAEPRWAPIGPEGGTISALAVAPSARRTLYAASSDGLIFRSTNAGATWSMVGRGLPFGSVASLLVDRRDASTLYAGLNGSVGKGAYRSEDGGETWTTLAIPFTNVWSLAMDPHDPDVLLAATGKGVFRSADGGASWSLTGLVPGQLFQEVVAVLFDPRTPGRAWAAQGVSTFVSDDGGITWTPRSSGLPAPGTGGVSTLAIDPASGTLYAGFSVPDGNAPLYRSTDDGASWTPVPLQEENWVLALAVSSGPAPTAYASTPSGIFRSTDGGASWSGPDPLGYGVLSFAVPPSPGSTVYAGAIALGVFKSTNRGASWRLSSRGLNAAEVVGFAVSPSNPSILYLSDRVRGVLRSTDGGKTWNPAGGGLPQGLAPRLLRVHPRDPRTAYAAADHGQIWKTANGGASWTFLSDGEDMGCMGTTVLEIDPVDPDNLYATGFNELSCERPHEEGCLGFRSADGGESWTCTREDGGRTIAIDPKRHETLFFGNDQQIFRSTDEGKTWKDLAAAFHQGKFLSTLVVAPRSPETVYAATNLGIFQSVDGGVTWRSRGTDLPRRPNVYDLAGSPSAAQVLYAAILKYEPALHRSSGLLYRTADGAASWTPVTLDGLPRGLLAQMQVHPSQPDVLFAAPDRGGLYRLTDAGGKAQ
jgi:photosystem II stability/assembly factor-like uncharacterized protein